MSKKLVLGDYVPGSAEYVQAHARWQKKRGRNLSEAFDDEMNPRKALLNAKTDLMLHDIWDGLHTGVLGSRYID